MSEATIQQKNASAPAAERAAPEAEQQGGQDKQGGELQQQAARFRQAVADDSAGEGGGWRSRLSNVMGGVSDWASERVNDLQTGVNGARDWAAERVDDARDWAEERVEDLQAGVNGARDWAEERVNDVREAVEGKIDEFIHETPPPSVRDNARDANNPSASHRADLAADDFTDHSGSRDLNGDGTVNGADRDLNGDGTVGDAADFAALVESRRDAVNGAVESWDEAQQARYRALEERVAANPKAVKALQDLALNGRLLEPPNADGDDLLTALDQLANVDVAEGIDQDELLGQVIQEVANPLAIHQGGANTCGPTSIGQRLAEDSPAEYARLITGLASKAGEVALQNGATISREAGSIGDDRGRSQSTALLASALMEYAEPGADYNAENDTSGLVPGVMPWDYERLMDGVLGESREFRANVPDYSPPIPGLGGLIEGANEARSNQLLKAVQEDLDNGETVPSIIFYGTEPHYVQIQAVSDDAVTFINPHGKLEEIDREMFEQSLIGVFL